MMEIIISKTEKIIIPDWCGHAKYIHLTAKICKECGICKYFPNYGIVKREKPEQGIKN